MGGPPQIEPNELFTITEAAALLPPQRGKRKGVGRSVAWRWAKEGKLRTVLLTVAGKKLKRVQGRDILRLWEVEPIGPELPPTQAEKSRRSFEVRKALRERHGL